MYGTIHILCQHNFGLFLTHPQTKCVSINTVCTERQDSYRAFTILEGRLTENIFCKKWSPKLIFLNENQKKIC